MQTMYDGVNGSPQKKIANTISANVTTIPLDSTSNLPDAPNLATIGNSSDAEVVLYATKSSTALIGCTRGFGGTTARSWPANTPVYRAFTKYDYDALKSNINEIAIAYTGDRNAASIANAPAGNIAATTVQAAIIELDTEKEAVANKVTSLSGASTDTQYPSAKCTYGAISALGDKVGELKDTVGYIFENRFVYDTQYNRYNIYTSGCSVTTSNEKLTITASETTIRFGNSLTEGTPFPPTLPYGYPLKVGDVSKIHVEVSDDTFNRCYVTFLNSSYVSLGFSDYFVAVTELDVPENAEYCLLRIGSSNAVSGTSYTITVIVCDATKPHSNLLSYVNNNFEEDRDDISALQEIGYDAFPGYLSSDGGVLAPGPDTREIYTNLIPIKKGDSVNISITLTESKSMWGAYCLYDENKNFISRTTSINSVTGSEFERTITLSSDSASFICYSYRTYGISEMKISMSNPSVVLFNTMPDVSLVNYKNPIVKCVNHRGYNSIAPENTLPAFRLSRKMGFEYVETDVAFTSDGVSVLLHDDTINRTARNADGTEISETVNINDITYEQALTYDFGIYKGEQYAGTKIPTVAEFFALCRLLGLLPYVEFKSGGTYTQAQIEGVIDIAKSYGMADKTTWISFSDTFLGYVKAYDSKARLGYVCESPGDTQIAIILSLRTEENEVFADCHYTSINSTGAGKCIGNGIPLEGWTCDLKADLLALNPYVSGVTTNSLNVAEILFFGGMIE